MERLTGVRPRPGPPPEGEGGSCGRGSGAMAGIGRPPAGPVAAVRAGHGLTVPRQYSPIGLPSFREARFRQVPRSMFSLTLRTAPSISSTFTIPVW